MSPEYEAATEIRDAIAYHTEVIVPILERIAASLEPLAAQARTEHLRSKLDAQKDLEVARWMLNGLTTAQTDAELAPYLHSGMNRNEHIMYSRKEIANILAAWPELAEEVEA
jgi:hypothetical protein